MRLRGLWTAFAAALYLVAAPLAAKEKAAPSGANGARVGKAGSFELGIAGLYDIDPDDETAAYIDLSLGYFVWEGIGLGVLTMNGTTREGKRDTHGVFVEYDFVSPAKVTPFGGTAFKHAAPPANSDGEDAQVWDIYAGAKLSISRAAALAATLRAEYANHAVLGSENARKKRNRELALSLRLFL